MRTTVNIKKLNESATIPTQGSDNSAGFDLYACMEQPITIPPHMTIKIGTGLSMELPNGTFGAIYPRSGLATKHGIRPANCVGVCDSDYRGEYIIPVFNDREEPYTIYPNDRIAQLIVSPYMAVNFNEVEELNNTARGDGGFGSSGK